MKEIIAHFVRISISSILILTLVLIQFPVVSLAYGLRARGPAVATPVTAPPVVFSNSSSITITDRASTTSPNGVATPYPSTISVSGVTGALVNVNVSLFGYNAARPRDTEFALVGPGGQALMLMSDAGDLTSTSPGVNLTFSDSGATAVPTGSGSTIPSGTYRPTDLLVASPAGNDTFPAPGPSSVNSPAPAGSATLGSVFNGIDPNGTWSLFAIDDSLGGGASTVTGGWSIEITADENIALTSTSVVSSLNPALTTQNITFTATVTSGGNPVTTGSVGFKDNGSPIATCTGVALDGSGNAACTVMLSEGSHNIVATYGGAPSFAVSSGSVLQTVNSATVVNGAQFCNNGGLSIPDLPSVTNPYPSNITVSSLFGTVAAVTVNLNGITSPRPNNLDFLLVGPGGQAFQLKSDTGDATTAASNVNITLDDAAGSFLPIGLPLTSGTFRPTDAAVVGAPDVYPAPAPGSFSQPAPSGAATFSSVYGGTNPNGNWALYAVDDSIGGGTSSLTGWCVNFSVSPFSTSTALASSLNPSNTGDSVTFTATVTASGGGTPSGSVTFLDGASPIGSGSLNGSGVATFATSSLTSGSHNISAAYQGASIGAGGGGFSASTSNTVVQVVRSSPTANPDGYSTDEDTPLTVAAPGVLGNDTDPDPGTTLTAILVSGPSNAQSFTLNANGSFNYTPSPNFSGSDSFTYKARDNTNLDSNVTTVTITVNAVDDGPEVVVAPGGTCGESTNGTINLTVSDSDTPVQNLTLSATSSNTALVPNANITFAGTGTSRTMSVVAVPQATVQSSTITITISDGSGGSSQLTVTVTVGTNGMDNITGTTGTDIIFGRNDQDTINAGNGIDLVCGGSGNDVISGGSGADTLFGDNGDDTLNGGDGNDTLIGGNGNDTLNGNNDDDTLTGGSGADFFSGGPGVDTATDVTPSQGDTTDGSLGLLREYAELFPWLADV